MARAAVVLAVAAALLAAAAHPARAGTDVCDATGSREGGDSLITSTEKNHWFGEVSQGIGTYWESGASVELGFAGCWELGAGPNCVRVWGRGGGAAAAHFL